MDLPQIGTVHGDWDLRDTIDDYLGHFDFTGKRCLDIRAAGGFLSFEMERRGAREVVSMDLEPAQPMDYVPYTENTKRQLDKLAALKPRTLAAMHGSTFVGDGASLLAESANILRDVSAAANVNAGA